MQVNSFYFRNEATWNETFKALTADVRFSATIESGPGKDYYLSKPKAIAISCGFMALSVVLVAAAVASVLLMVFFSHNLSAALSHPNGFALFLLPVALLGAAALSAYGAVCMMKRLQITQITQDP